jgi:hypothetical protein
VEAVADPTPVPPRRRAPSEAQADRAAPEAARPPSFEAFKEPKPLEWSSPVPKNAAAPNTAPKEAPATPSSARTSAVRDEVVPLPARHQVRDAERDVTEVKDPDRGSRLGRVVGKIPLLRKLKKHPHEPGADGGQ